MRVDQRHQRRETQVARTDYANVTVCLRRVLDQPLDGVVGIGRFVDAGFVQWSRDRAIEDPLSLGPMHAADVLVHADVVVCDKFRIHYFEYVDDALAIDAARRTARVIGRARQQDWCFGNALFHHHDGEEFDAVAHRDHDLAPNIVGGRKCLVVLLDDVRCHRSNARRRLGDNDRTCE